MNVYLIRGFIAVIFLVPIGAYAQANLIFPIPELGGCGNKDECRIFCDLPENISACLEFASQSGLSSSSSDAKTARQFSQALLSRGTPGECKTISECVSYCDEASHIDECLAFADNHNIHTGATESIKRVSAYLKEGGRLPGECDSQEACFSYCLNPKNISECVSFAINIGIMPGAEEVKIITENISVEPIENTEEVATETSNYEENIATTTEESPEAEVPSETVISSGGGAGGETVLPDNALVAPEVFRFASFPEYTAACLRERLGEDAETEIVEGAISNDEFRTAIESCILETLSLDETLNFEELLIDTSAASMSPARTFVAQMLATPLRVGDYILRFLRLKD